MEYGDFHKDRVIELGYLLNRIWSNWYKILTVTFLGIFFSASISRYILQPVYYSEVKLYIVGESSLVDSNILMTDKLEVGDQLINDYKELVLSTTVINNVRDKLNIKEGLENLQNNIQIVVPLNTRVISIGVTNEDPRVSALIANELASVSSEKLMNMVDGAKVNLISKADIPSSPISPNIMKNVILGGILTMFISISIVFLKIVLDSRVRRPEDIELTMPVEVIGIVPKLK